MKRLVTVVLVLFVLTTGLVWGDDPVFTQLELNDMVFGGVVELVGNEWQLNIAEGYATPILRQWVDRATGELLIQQIHIFDRTVPGMPEASANCGGGACAGTPCQNSEGGGSYCQVIMQCPTGDVVVSGNCSWYDGCPAGSPLDCNCIFCTCILNDYDPCDLVEWPYDEWADGPGSCPDPFNCNKITEMLPCIPIDDDVNCANTNSCECTDEGGGDPWCPLCLNP